MRSQLLGFEGRVVYAIHHFGFLRVHDLRARCLQIIICRLLVLAIHHSFGVFRAFLLLLRHAILPVLLVQPAEAMKEQCNRDRNRREPNSIFASGAYYGDAFGERGYSQECKHRGHCHTSSGDEERPRKRIHGRRVNAAVHWPVDKRHQALAHAEQRIHLTYEIT